MGDVARPSVWTGPTSAAGGDLGTIVLVHDFYQKPGGEDAVFATEGELLDSRGHTVVRFTIHNDRIERMGWLRLGVASIWNQDVYRELREVLRREQPSIVHFHNTFPLISPAAYYAAHAEGVAVVQTLHNYRLVCANSMLYRDGRVCEDCLGKPVGWPGIAHACYRGSRLLSAGVVALQTSHSVAGTWAGEIDSYIVLTEFARSRFIAGGLPEERLHIKPNFVFPDPGPEKGGGGFALYVGRLTEEKGVLALLAGWDRAEIGLPLKIVGDGPLASVVARKAEASGGRIEGLGQRSSEEVLGLMGRAEFLVVPSQWYEGFPRVIVEALARGTPIVAASVGAATELVREGRTGLLFAPGDVAGMVDRVNRLAREPATLAEMRSNARAEYEAKYTAETNYEQLIGIYAAALARRAG